MNRKIFYAPSTIKALCEKLIGRLSEYEILDIEETLTRMAICAIEKKECHVRVTLVNIMQLVYQHAQNKMDCGKL